MNYLILTPDGVGSTILQRLLTIALSLEKVPVVNTHELTNGIELTKTNSILKKLPQTYLQDLKTIENILLQCDKKLDIVSRLAKYHMDARQDQQKNADEFYKFCNKFFKRRIICLRKNIFEYAMSWSIREQSGVLNIYKREDRKKVLSVTKVDEDYFLKKCQEYVQYITWTENNFSVTDKVYYEDLITNTDTVIDKLTGYSKTFEKTLNSPLFKVLQTEYNFINNIPLDKKTIIPLVKYKRIANDLVDNNIMPNHPIKNSTLFDKKAQISNFQNCLDKFYVFAKNHNWINQSNATFDFWSNRDV